ncbi:hypothetical protein J6590_074279 [Homalodisca vitripennis]|nr:hypothetical protein J6590_074279 [Homalodisca vitripennis]
MGETSRNSNEQVCSKMWIGGLVGLCQVCKGRYTGHWDVCVQVWSRMALINKVTSAAWSSDLTLPIR